MKFAIARKGLIIAPENAAEELYLESIVAGKFGVGVKHNKPPQGGAWGQIEIFAAPAPEVPVDGAPEAPPPTPGKGRKGKEA